jgi:hypothetical protein
MWWDYLRLNLLGDPKYNPTQPRVMKWDSLVNKIAGDIVAFVDDLRASSHSVEQAWAISHQVVLRLQYLGLQDAPQKRRPPVWTPSTWAGAAFKTTDTEVLQSISQDKWCKCQLQISKVTEGFKKTSNKRIDFDYKHLEQIRGFLCHVSMTYPVVTPYLKGLHLTLASHHPGR